MFILGHWNQHFAKCRLNLKAEVNMPRNGNAAVIFVMTVQLFEFASIMRKYSATNVMSTQH